MNKCFQIENNCLCYFHYSTLFSKTNMGRPWEKNFPEMPEKPVIGKIIIISISSLIPSKRVIFYTNIFSNF